MHEGDGPYALPLPNLAPPLRLAVVEVTACVIWINVMLENLSNRNTFPGIVSQIATCIVVIHRIELTGFLAFSVQYRYLLSPIGVGQPHPTCPQTMNQNKKKWK